MFAARSFFITVNDITCLQSVLDYLQSLSTLNYLLAARELSPTTCHAHAHIYAQFTVSTRLSPRKLRSAHTEKCYASPKRNIEYVKKCGDIILEHGNPRLAGTPTKREMERMPPDDLSWNMLKTYWELQRRKHLQHSTANIIKDVKLYYIHGEGCQAIIKAREILQSMHVECVNFVSFTNGYLQGSDGTTTSIIYTNFTDDTVSYADFLNLTSNTYNILNTKNSSLTNIFTLIIFTSAQPLDSLYSDITDRSFTDRFITINCFLD